MQFQHSHSRWMIDIYHPILSQARSYFLAAKPFVGQSAICCPMLRRRWLWYHVEEEEWLTFWGSIQQLVYCILGFLTDQPHLIYHPKSLRLIGYMSQNRPVAKLLDRMQLVYCPIGFLFLRCVAAFQECHENEAHLATISVFSLIV
jgi:hypothetical protein